MGGWHASEEVKAPSTDCRSPPPSPTLPPLQPSTPIALPSTPFCERYYSFQYVTTRSDSQHTQDYSRCDSLHLPCLPFVHSPHDWTPPSTQLHPALGRTVYPLLHYKSSKICRSIAMHRLPIIFYV